MLVCWNDNGPVTVVSNVREDLPLITVKCWDSSAKNHIKIDRPYSITKYIYKWAELIPLMLWSVFIKLMYI